MSRSCQRATSSKAGWRKARRRRAIPVKFSASTGLRFVRHGRGALLLGGEGLGRLGDFAALQVAQLHAQALDGGPEQGESGEPSGMAVARDDLGGDGLGAQPQGLPHRRPRLRAAGGRRCRPPRRGRRSRPPPGRQPAAAARGGIRSGAPASSARRSSPRRASRGCARRREFRGGPRRGRARRRAPAPSRQGGGRRPRGGRELSPYPAGRRRVIPKWSQRASSPPFSAKASKKAMTSWRSSASSSATRAGSGGARPCRASGASIGAKPHSAAALRAACSTRSQRPKRASSLHRAAISGRL